MLIPLVPAAVIALALIVAQPDLGQTVSLGIILLGLLWYAGLPLRVFLSARWSPSSVSAAMLAVSEGYRSDRVQSWLNPGADAQGSGYQARQARFALANGGVFGDGLGQGTAKWNYLPNATTTSSSRSSARNSGFVGAVGLLCLFGLFAYTGMRIARRSADPFLRLLTATATLWVLGQVFINVGYVVGLLPVTGLQLPLISAGGTSTAHNTFDDRHHGECGAPRTRGGGRAAGRTGRPGQPATAAAAAGRRTCRPAPRRCATGCGTRPGRAARPQARSASPTGKPATRTNAQTPSG